MFPRKLWSHHQVDAAVYQPLQNLKRDSEQLDGYVRIGVLCRFICVLGHDGSTAPDLREIGSTEARPEERTLCIALPFSLRFGE